MSKRPKVIGVGLNKTGTKTLASYLEEWGYRNRSYDLEAFNKFREGRIEELLDEMEHSDSFEDWPWPLMYREIAERYPDAKFILTRRKSPETWYRSLCQMAIRRGPFVDFEQHIYGYSMPHGRKEEHLTYYKNHYDEVEKFFETLKPEQHLNLCWEEGDTGERVADFLGEKLISNPTRHKNRGSTVYSGENLFLAHCHRIFFQKTWRIQRVFKNPFLFLRRVVRSLRRRLGN